MTEIVRSALVMHSAKTMYRLVNDVEAYPKFLPWCAGARLIDESPEEMTASLEISKGKIRQKFTTCNRLVEDQRIEMQLVDGPFKAFRGVWQFTPLTEHACRVSLQLNFEFAGRLGTMAFGPMFNQAANGMVDSFCKRADEVYG